MCVVAARLRVTGIAAQPEHQWQKQNEQDDRRGDPASTPANGYYQYRDQQRQHRLRQREAAGAESDHLAPIKAEITSGRSHADMREHGLTAKPHEQKSQGQHPQVPGQAQHHTASAEYQNGHQGDAAQGPMIQQRAEPQQQRGRA